MASQGEAPAGLARIHPRTRTPLRATVLVCAVTVALAWLLPVVALARATSLLLLSVFAVVNAALFVLKRRGAPALDGPSYPIWIPALGAVFSVAFVAVELARLWA
jgi:amino acid transporter